MSNFSLAKAKTLESVKIKIENRSYILGVAQVNRHFYFVMYNIDTEIKMPIIKEFESEQEAREFYEDQLDMLNEENNLI